MKDFTFSQILNVFYRNFWRLQSYWLLHTMISHLPCIVTIINNKYAYLQCRSLPLECLFLVFSVCSVQCALCMLLTSYSDIQIFSFWHWNVQSMQFVVDEQSIITFYTRKMATAEADRLKTWQYNGLTLLHL